MTGVPDGRRTGPRGRRLVVLLAATAGAALAPWGVAAQQAQPLVKSEVVRLLVTDTYGARERQQIVRRSCLTFTPTTSDLEDFRRLGASQEMLEIIRTCADTAASGGQGGAPDTPPAGDGPGSAPGAVPSSETGGQLPPRPGEIAVSAPAILEPADTGGVSILSLPRFDTSLTAHSVRPPAPAPQENILSRVEVPPRLLNPAEVQRMLRGAAPDSVRGDQGGMRCVVWVYVDPSGSVRQARLEASSGADAFDRAALEVARSMEFTPGTAGNRPVGMWVQQTLSLRR